MARGHRFDDRRRPGLLPWGVLACLVALTPRSSSACELDHHDDVDWGYYERLLQAAEGKSAPPPGRFEARALLRYSRGATPALTGGYAEARPRVEYRASRFATGLSWPVVAVDTGDDLLVAVANPVLFGELRFAPSASTELSFGAQLEVPVGTDERVAPSHVEVLPYALARVSVARVAVTSVAGLRRGLEGDAHDHRTQLLVDPHARSELLLGLRAQLLATLRPLLALDAQRVLDEDEHGTRTYVTSSLIVPFRLSDLFALQLSGEVPLTRPSRFGWRAGAGLAVTP